MTICACGSQNLTHVYTIGYVYTLSVEEVPILQGLEVAEIVRGRPVAPKAPVAGEERAGEVAGKIS